MRLMIAEVIGEGYDLDLDITRDTSFAEDIEIESIEFVAFGELLRETYGERVDLVAWFGEMDVDQIIALTVGEVVDYVVRCTS
jgi:acyl carrier protein